MVPGVHSPGPMPAPPLPGRTDGPRDLASWDPSSLPVTQENGGIYFKGHREAPEWDKALRAQHVGALE